MATAEGKRNDLLLTKDEIARFSDAFKDPKFRELFSEYAQEIRDPQNRALYEKEIRQLEQERGVNVTFIHPEPCYVIKTSVNGDRKAFINICSNANVGEPCCQRATEGYHWQLPYSLAPPREDLDKRKTRCQVYDIVFHPNTLYMGVKNYRFKKMVEETAIEAVENNFNVKLDKKNVKFPKMKFKGVPTSTVVRKVGPEGLKPTPNIAEKFCVPYPELKPDAYRNGDAKCGISETNAAVNNANETKATVDDKTKVTDECCDTSQNEATKPKHVIKFRKHFDIGDFANDVGDAHMATRNIPQELVIEIDLPLISSASSIDLDVTEKNLALKTDAPAKYELQLPLPYTVDSEQSKAKFDVSTRKLTVTLTVTVSREDDFGVNGANDSNAASESESSDSDKEDVTNDVDVPDNDDDDDDNKRTNVTNDIDVPDDDDNKRTKITYQLPLFNARQTADKIILLAHVRNVDPKSVVKEVNADRTLVSVSFVTLGAGFVPFHYKLIVKADRDKFFDNEVTFDATDKNAVMAIGKRGDSEGDWQHVDVGTDEMHLTQVTFNTIQRLSERMAQLKAETEEQEKIDRQSFNDKILVTKLTDELLEVSIGNNREMSSLNSVDDPHENGCANSVQRSFDVQEVFENVQESSISSRGTFSSEVRGHRTKSASICIPDIPTRPKIHKVRSISESGEDWNRNPAHKPRGILKLRKFCRSISESSDDFSISPQDIVSSPDKDIPEESSNDEGNQVKKSVRFNEVVCRSLFRSNSSILGQRKKNQRKQRAKKKAVQRRMSESEGSEGESDGMQLENSRPNIHKPVIDNTSEKDNGVQDDTIDNLCTRVGDISISDGTQSLGAVSDDNANAVENLNVYALNGNTDDNSNSVQSESVIVDEDARESATDELKTCGVKNSKEDSKMKRKRKCKPKHASNDEMAKTMMSWDDYKTEEMNHDGGISFSNALMFELDT